MQGIALSAIILLLSGWFFKNIKPEIKNYPEPEKVSWQPLGIGNFGKVSAIESSSASFRTMHGDLRNSDEIGMAYAPVFRKGWVAEEHLYVPEGPTFDNQGNIYFVPLNPPEDVLLVSIEPELGQRRWAIPGRRKGIGGAPLILNDEERGGNTIFFGSYEYITAVSSEGGILWDQHTGLVAKEGMSPGSMHNFGVNYIAQWDALASLTGDGHLIVVDRKTCRTGGQTGIRVQQRDNHRHVGTTDGQHRHNAEQTGQCNYRI